MRPGQAGSSIPTGRTKNAVIVWCPSSQMSMARSSARITPRREAGVGLPVPEQARSLVHPWTGRSQSIPGGTVAARKRGSSPSPSAQPAHRAKGAMSSSRLVDQRGAKKASAASSPPRSRGARGIGRGVVLHGTKSQSPQDRRLEQGCQVQLNGCELVLTANRFRTRNQCVSAGPARLCLRGQGHARQRCRSSRTHVSGRSRMPVHQAVCSFPDQAPHGRPAACQGHVS